MLPVPGVADGVFQQVDDHLLDEHGLHGEIQNIVGQLQGDGAVGKPAAHGEQSVPRHLLQHLLLLVQGHDPVPDLGDGEQILHHGAQGVGVALDVPHQGGAALGGGDLLAGQ